MERILLIAAMLIPAFSCMGKSPSLYRGERPPEKILAEAPDTGTVSGGVRTGEGLGRILERAELPPEIAGHITENTPAFMEDLERILAEEDPFLRILVDKQHPLPAAYEPDDLVELRYGSYRAGISDPMMLRRKAEAALEEMAAAAKAEGLVLTVSSAYRSYEYQIGSFDRWTRRLGLTEAERVSARPGHSQHQLGLVVDFGSITNEFAETAAGKWVKANAGRFGWSISFPRGYEELTGYAWESWHYRYTGRELCVFIDRWFGGIQQYALRFIHEWEQFTGGRRP
ncbi:MAG: M15 family metallopeptidase [Spirochaetaceae bacterium]|jgi:D-alanyl-D-alanine carboxypeptidase|nr:M15 family metallopeptidase [Spirochaetaceae bacterium]